MSVPLSFDGKVVIVTGAGGGKLANSLLTSKLMLFFMLQFIASYSYVLFLLASVRKRAIS